MTNLSNEGSLQISLDHLSEANTWGPKCKVILEVIESMPYAMLRIANHLLGCQRIFANRYFHGCLHFRNRLNSS